MRGHSQDDAMHGEGWLSKKNDDDNEADEVESVDTGSRQALSSMLNEFGWFGKDWKLFQHVAD